MPTPIVTNGVQVLIRYSQLGEPTENVLWFTCIAAVDDATLEDMADVIQSWLEDDWMTHLPTGTSCTSILLTDFTSNTGARLERVFSPPIAGTSGTNEPNQVTFCIQKLVQERYRGGHGRLYVPGIATASRTSNQISQAAADNLTADLELLRTTMLTDVTNTPIEVVLRTTGDGASQLEPRAIAVTGHKYTDLVLDVQRRRLPAHNVHD